jgi:hypothetical protein
MNTTKKDPSMMNLGELREEWKATYGKATTSKDTAGLRKAIVKARAEAQASPPEEKKAEPAGGAQLDVTKLVPAAAEAEKRGEFAIAASLWAAAAGLTMEPLSKKYAENAAQAAEKALAAEKPARKKAKKGKRPEFAHDPRVLAKHPVGSTWTVSALGYEVAISVIGNGFLATAKKDGAVVFEADYFRRLALLERRITGKPAKNSLATFGVDEGRRSGLSHDEAVVAIHEVNTVLGAGFKVQAKTAEQDAERLGELVRKVKAAARAFAREQQEAPTAAA